MLDRIDELLGGVRHATDHIAHDLRTPLTRLRNRLEELRRQPGDRARNAALDAAVAETDQLLRTFASLLWLARIEAQAPAQRRAGAGAGGAGRATRSSCTPPAPANAVSACRPTCSLCRCVAIATSCSRCW